MLSSSTYKAKAPKSTLNEYEHHSEESYETNSVEGEGPDTQYNASQRFRGARSKPKVVERRGGFRGRTAPFQKRERDDFYVLNRKYQESRHSEQSGYHGKCYESEKNKEMKLNLPEDTRISKLLRRLSNETNPDASLAISKKLLEVLLLPDNSQYVRKAFHILGESMYDILHVSPGPLAKQQAARALGRMGYIMGQEGEFERYQNWLFVKLKSSQDDMQNLLMKSFRETFAFELDKPVLQNHAEQLMQNCVTFIEQTENCEVFKTSLDVLMTCVEIYPDCFYRLFQDTVDLLFGWHVDHTQPLENIEFISRNLLRISQHFKYNLDFALGLIENFLEDIGNYTEVLEESDNLQHVTVLILALNTVLKCLSDNFNKALTSVIVTQCLVQVIKTAQAVLAVKTSDDLLIAANESVGILLEQLDTKTQAISSSIYVLIDLEIDRLNDLCDISKVSLLVLISKIIKELSANLPAELITKLIGPQSDILKLRYSHLKQLRESLIGVYRALLNLKNVSLLQDAYRFILGDLENCYRLIVPVEKFIADNPFDGVEIPADIRELSVLFLLRCLSQLANASSIIVMWALNPNFLELLGNYLEPHKQQLTPALRYSILFLLYSHCKCYNHFITSSNLVAKQDLFKITDGPSPNLGNFEIILDILHRNLSIDTESEVMLLLIQWFNDILRHSESYLKSLYETETFAKLCEVLVKCGYSFDTKVARGVCDNLNKLLSNKELAWNARFLTNVCDLCKLHMGSNHCELRQSYSELCSHLPWDVATVELNKSCTIYDIKKKHTNVNYSNFMVWMAQHLHLNTSISGDMYPLHFKKFMDYLLLGQPKNELLEDIFISNYKSLDFFYELALNSQVVLTNWTTLESAQFCINAKLRTPLGKPNETFTKIESALNQVGNELIANKPCTGDAERIGTLLQFVEHLEKCLYNACEGCAVAMQQPPKPVRCFFITNTNTCSEWLNRIRLVVMHIAIHSGESSTVLRHGQALLNDLVQADKTNSNEFERVVVFLTQALVSMREAEALLGLYVWCKNHTPRKMLFIKSAAEQAAQRYENAVEGYKKLLRTELENETKWFVYDQIIVCYKSLGDFMELMNWYVEENPDGMTNGRKYWFHVTDWKALNNLFDFETGRVTFTQLSSWEYKDESKCWSQFGESTRLESNLYAIALSLQDHSNDTRDKVKVNLSQVQKGIREQLSSAPNESLKHLLVLQYASLNLLNVLDENTASGFLVSENYESQVPYLDSNILRKILWWSEYFTPTPNTFTGNLRLDVMKRARKEKNFRLAFNQVCKFDKDFTLVPGDLAGSLLQQLHAVTQWSKNTALATLEIVKLSYLCDSKSKQACYNLCAAVSTAISQQAHIFPNNDLSKISARLLLKMSKWLQLGDEVTYELNTPLGQMLLDLPDIDPVSNKIIPANELIIGKLLRFTVDQCPSFAKSWYIFGTWCYRWGRRIVDHSLDVHNNLSDEDSSLLKELLPNASESDLEQLVKILSQSKNNIEDEDISINEINTSEMIKNQLRCVQVLRNVPEAVVEALVQIWSNTQRRIYTYYALSAESYFKYLQLAMDAENCKASTDSNVVTVTLRLLRLIVKYALELQGILEEGLERTPTRPWKVIIPQLFSRLNHPESYVRDRVSDLLCRIAEDSPHLITFPAVVGALEGGLKFDFSEITLPKDCLSQNQEVDEVNDEEDYESDSEEHKNTLQSCFKTMVDTLSKQDPETIAQVQTLVKELRRITLLWDELWLGTLAQHQSEIQKRQTQLEYEIDRVQENVHLTKEDKLSLIAEKHRIIVKPIVFVLEQLQEVTSVDAETPHEKDFQERYSTEIRKVIELLKHPEHPEKPQESLQPLKSLQKQFQQKFHKRASYTLKMQEISPILSSIRNTLIAMPGLDTKKRVTISHVSNTVSIMPTKTKPKKLIFHGSDGQTYPYLFKGLEDLHLDERIMQFLSIANTMMAHSVDHADSNLYRARHYPVIPLGPRSGLISWVDGTTPVFALYKRWQQREISKANLKNNSSGNVSVPRPSELFYTKLNPLLKEHGVKNVDNRKEWPLSVLKQVLCELMAETPSDLLAKELWCNAISANAWWHVVKRYSYSVAVMSAIGYIIGLGDRHLDNVLIDLTSGEVVHIDYNVCFEKGKTLRVPEKVPFRLTPNIKAALGVTGVEGIFRLTCENVLKTMRKGRETLLTLLEAFVYDPLIDWTVGNEVLAGTSFGGAVSINTKQSKKDLEKEVTLAMFNVRCIEMKVEWFENKDEILAEIPPLLDGLNSWQRVNSQITSIDDNLQDLHQQLALVKEAEARAGANNKHPLYNLPSRYDNYCKTQEAIKTARKDLDKITSESESHVTNYLAALKAIDGDLECVVRELPPPQEANSDANASANVFDLVKEFLHNAGKNDVITQCEQSEHELEHLAQLQSMSLRRCWQFLQEYNAILTQCPRTYVEYHRMFLYLTWCRLLVDTRSVDSCDVVYEKFRMFLDLANAKNTLDFTFGLDNLYKDVMAQVGKLYEELTRMRSVESTSALEKLYASARLGVGTFLNCEANAAGAFEFVLANELVIVNKSFLTLETAASRSGDLLIKLTSRDGDWFFDELVLSSTRVVELINNLPVRPHEQELRTCLSGVRTANNIYKGLHELHYNFHTIILPESMKKIQSEEASVVQMMAEVGGLVKELQGDLADVVGQLEKILPCVYMQMEIDSSHEHLLARIASIRSQYQNLVQNRSETLSPGKMLLMGFNGLFDKLSQELNTLVSTLQNLQVPQAWAKLDHVKEAKSISAHITNPRVFRLLEDIFFLKRLQTINEFFGLASEMCSSFKNPKHACVLNDAQLLRPVRQFIADFIAKQLLGTSTEIVAYTVCFLLRDLGLDVSHEIEQKDIGAESRVALDELCHKAWNHFVKNGLFTQNLVSQATTFSANLKNAWEKIQEPKRIEVKLAVLQSSAMRLQNQLTVYNFMYEEILSQLHVYPTVRTKFIADLKSEMANLKTLHARVKEAYDTQKTLIENAHQRLNWAKGANPNVVEISAAFEEAVNVRDANLSAETAATVRILKCCDVILQHEVLRTQSNESKKWDKLFLNSFEKWRIACQYASASTERLTALEESIMNLLAPSMVNNPKWLDEVSQLISDTIVTLQKDSEEQKECRRKVVEGVVDGMERFKESYGTHCRVMDDVKSLIKTMTKVEEYAAQTQRFVADYRVYNEHFRACFIKLHAELTGQELSTLAQHIGYVGEATPTIYADLLLLQEGGANGRCRLVRQDGVELGAGLSGGRSQVLEHKPTDNRGQQRNAYAVNVWKRVKWKLEGRDPDQNRKSTPQEQVDFVIREASNVDNLALLYEGWTPWV